MTNVARCAGRVGLVVARCGPENNFAMGLVIGKSEGIKRK